jgi:RHS repeat-associated protein
MKKTFLFIAFLTLILRGVTTAQNPYESLGVPMPKGKMLTVSNGRFLEHFPNDTLTPIGSAMFNTVTGEVVQFLTRDTMYAEYNLEPELVSRWLSPDPLAEKYMQWSPYNYTLNNPVRFIDPDGQDVKPVNLNNEHQKALYQFMQTKEGWNFVSQFAKKGETLKFDFGDGSKPFDITFQADGSRSKDLLVVSTFDWSASASGYGVAEGATQVYEGKENYDKTLSNADEKTDLSKGVTMVMQVASNKNADAAINVFGHEAFVHGDAANAKMKQIEASGLKPGTKAYIEAVKKVVDAAGDHKKLSEDGVTKYKTFSEQRDKIQNTNYYISKYKQDVQEHKK